MPFRIVVVVTQQAKYKRLWKTAEKLRLALGTDHELHKKFQLLMTELINKCKEIGPEYLTKFRMDWAAAETRVNHFIDVTSRCEVKFPDDEMVPILEYPKDFDPETGEEMGDPRTKW